MGSKVFCKKICRKHFQRFSFLLKLLLDVAILLFTLLLFTHLQSTHIQRNFYVNPLRFELSCLALTKWRYGGVTHVTLHSKHCITSFFHTKTLTVICSSYCAHQPDLAKVLSELLWSCCMSSLLCDFVISAFNGHFLLITVNNKVSQTKKTHKSQEPMPHCYSLWQKCDDLVLKQQ